MSLVNTCYYKLLINLCLLKSPVDMVYLLLYFINKSKIMLVTIIRYHPKKLSLIIFDGIYASQRAAAVGARASISAFIPLDSISFNSSLILTPANNQHNQFIISSSIFFLLMEWKILSELRLSGDWGGQVRGDSTKNLPTAGLRRHTLRRIRTILFGGGTTPLLSRDTILEKR